MTEQAPLPGRVGRRAAQPSPGSSQARPRHAPALPLGLLPLGTSSAALLASLVHELRTPVSALATGSELLLDDLNTLSREDLRRIVETMHRGAVWLQRLIENLLYAATVAEGEVRIYPRPLDLVELVRDVMPVVDPLLRQRGQKLRIVDRADGTRAAGDSRRIGQVLVNLIANASKFSAPSTAIEVQVARRGERIRLHVADRGPGLPAGETSRLFVAYARGGEVNAAGIDGAGLGLAIVKSIVDLHGGEVGATRRRGGGAIFWVELPVAGEAKRERASSRHLTREQLA